MNVDSGFEERPEGERGELQYFIALPEEDITDRALYPIFRMMQDTANGKMPVKGRTDGPSLDDYEPGLGADEFDVPNGDGAKTEHWHMNDDEERYMVVTPAEKARIDMWLAALEENEGVIPIPYSPVDDDTAQARAALELAMIRRYLPGPPVPRDEVMAFPVKEEKKGSDYKDRMPYVLQAYDLASEEFAYLHTVFGLAESDEDPIFRMNVLVSEDLPGEYQEGTVYALQQRYKEKGFLEGREYFGVAGVTKVYDEHGNCLGRRVELQSEAMTRTEAEEAEFAMGPVYDTATLIPTRKYNRRGMIEWDEDDDA